MPAEFGVSMLMRPTAQKALRELKSKISSQSKKNFVLEKDVRYLDSRIALLIQNRMALEEVSVFGAAVCLLAPHICSANQSAAGGNGQSHGRGR
jgi:hypothetical protein